MQPFSYLPSMVRCWSNATHYEEHAIALKITALAPTAKQTGSGTPSQPPVRKRPWVRVWRFAQRRGRCPTGSLSMAPESVLPSLPWSRLPTGWPVAAQSSTSMRSSGFQADGRTDWRTAIADRTAAGKPIHSWSRMHCQSPANPTSLLAASPAPWLTTAAFD